MTNAFLFAPLVRDLVREFVREHLALLTVKEMAEGQMSLLRVNSEL